MHPIAVRVTRVAALLLMNGACAAAMAQTSQWVPLPGIGLGKDVSAIRFDPRGLIDFENHNEDDDRPYPVALVLVDFSRQRDSGLLGSYRSMVHTVAVDCPGQRAQNVQDRLYAESGGLKRTAIMGTVALWRWDPKQATHPALARALFAQVCKN